MSDDTALALAEPMPSLALFGTSDPVEVIAQASRVATALAEVVNKRQLYAIVNQKKFPTVEAWTLLGSMLGVFPITEWTRAITDAEGNVRGYEARVRAQTLSGRIVGAGEAMCVRGESKTWHSNAQEFALRSMAQTRATSKALRGPLDFVFKLAGFQPTPAEEMSEATPATPATVTTDGEIINPSPQSRAAVQQASDERPGTREVGTPTSQLERVAPPATTPTPAEPNGKRRGRPLGSKNHKAETAPIPFGGTEAEPKDTLTPLRRDLFAVASRLLKLQYLEKGSDLPPSERWEAEVNKTLGVYITRKRGTDVTLDDLEEDSLRECIAELQGFVDAIMGDGPDPDAEPQLAEQEQVIPVPQHKPIVRNAVAAPRRSPANEATQIDPQAALSRARALADLRNRTTALLATREGLIQLTAKDEDRLRLQADTVMEKVAQNAFQVAIKNLDTQQLELLIERAKAASAP